MVASSEAVDTSGPRYELRMFNITSFEVTFADETLALRPLVAAIRSLQQVCRSHQAWPQFL